MTLRARTLLLAIVAAVVALGTACGDDDGNGDQASNAGSSAATTTTVSPPSSAQPCTPQGSADPVSGAPEAAFAQLVGVRSAGHPCVDRVTFEFRDGAQPGYQVGYEQGPILQPGSGNPVAVDGGAFLVVRLQPASGFDAGTSTPSYTGPATVEPAGASYVAQVVRSGDFEGTLTWVIGVDQQRPFTVARLQDPARIYIDVG